MVENAAKLFEKAIEHGLSPDQLFIDPIIMPLNSMQEQCQEILNAVSQFKLFSDPPVHIVCGLSNISSGAKYKKLINRTFMTMLIGQGLDAAIFDVTDTEMIDTILTAEIILNKTIYADGYVEAFRKS